MKLQRIIKYVLSKNGVVGNLFSRTRTSDIVRTSDDRVTFQYATASTGGVYGSTSSVTYDNTRTFIVTVGGATAMGVTVSITGLTYSTKVNTGYSTGRFSIYLPDDAYTYTAIAFTGATAAGTFTIPPSGGTTSVVIP